MAYQYTVTVQKPTAVSYTTVGKFTSSDALNLIVAKGNVLDIHVVTPEGLTPLLSTNIYGTISAIQLFRPTGLDKDLLFLATENRQFCVLSFEEISKEIRTNASGDNTTRLGRLADTGQFNIVDPKGRALVMRVYEGLLKAVSISPDGKLLEAIDLRLQELCVLDMKFLHGYANPTFAVLYKEQTAHHVSVYTLDFKQSAHELLFEVKNVDVEARMLIPVPSPSGGFIVVGRSSLTYCNKDTKKPAVELSKPLTFTTFTTIDGGDEPEKPLRFLLGDDKGQIYLLVMVGQAELKLELLGGTSIASALSYLGERVVFVGSHFGDSQLVRISSEKNENDSCIEILENYCNVGPIVDMCVVDIDRQGQSQLVTASGAFQNGSLRIVRNGIGINEQASLDLEGVRGIWSLRRSTATATDSLLALSFVGQTAFLAIEGDQLEGLEVAGADDGRSSLLLGNTADCHVLQVTEASIRLIHGERLTLLDEWKTSPDKPLSVAAANGRQIIVASGMNLMYFDVEGEKIVLKSEKTLENEVACLNISPLGSNDTASFVAVGLWGEISVRILALPSLDTVFKELLAGDIIPRSVLMAEFEGCAYVLCALGDGALFTFELSQQGSLSNSRRVQLAFQPIELTAFQRGGATHVFASSDQPTVIYSSHQKLLFSSVNRSDIVKMCPINTDAFPESLVLISSSSLTIGSINEIQKLQIRKVDVQETIIRVRHLSGAHCFAVLTTAFTELNDGLVSRSSVKLLDEQTFEVLTSFELPAGQSGFALYTAVVGGQSFCFVGTATVKDEVEPSNGNLFVLRVGSERQLEQNERIEVNGCCTSFSMLGGCLLASVNSELLLFALEVGDSGILKLSPKTKAVGLCYILFTKVLGSFVLVGDYMMSMSLMTYNGDKIEEIASSQDPQYLTSLEIIDDDTFIAGESQGNVFILKRGQISSTDETLYLETAGEYYIGHQINAIEKGTLAMRTKEPEVGDVSLLMGTAAGSILQSLSLSENDFSFFAEVQARLNNVIKGVGGFSHLAWRGFKSAERRTEESAKQFVDGDLIESFLDLPLAKKQEVVAGFKFPDANGVEREITVDSLSQRIEDMVHRH